MTNEKRLINAAPLMEDGWHLVKTGKSNVFLASMSLADVPIVDATPVMHGRWIICSDGYYPYCSECKKEPKNGEMTNYCPNCGADMR